jgi:nicotinamidase/pyrazinamidase
LSGPEEALILVDLQGDFLPAGALAVPGGAAILKPVRALMESNRFELQVATQDWHPRDHISFASRHPGKEPLETIRVHDQEQTLWPDHCIQGTEGAALCPALPWDRVAAVTRKGMHPDRDSYSAFRNSRGPDGRRAPTGLAGYLRERGVRHVYLCGLARDVCVRWTAEDAAEMGFQVTFLWDLTRPVDPGTDEQVRNVLTARGVRVLDSPAAVAVGATA